MCVFREGGGGGGEREEETISSASHTTMSFYSQESQCSQVHLQFEQVGEFKALEQINHS